jgi:FMN phosphatase YigB (HAD superfamily)
MEIGDFTREQCESALRVSFYNADTASFYLISGNIPTTPQSDPRSVDITERQRASDTIGEKIKRWDELEEDVKGIIVEIAKRAGKEKEIAMAYQLWCVTNGDPEKTYELLIEEP